MGVDNPGNSAPPSVTTPFVTNFVITHVNYGLVPQAVTCPHCRQSVVTEIEPESGILTWIIFGVLFLLLCWLCCWIPFCVDGCKDVRHKCPNCKAILGKGRRIGWLILPRLKNHQLISSIITDNYYMTECLFHTISFKLHSLVYL